MVNSGNPPPWGVVNLGFCLTRGIGLVAICGQDAIRESLTSVGCNGFIVTVVQGTVIFALGVLGGMSDSLRVPWQKKVPPN